MQARSIRQCNQRQHHRHFDEDAHYSGQRCAGIKSEQAAR